MRRRATRWQGLVLFQAVFLQRALGRVGLWRAATLLLDPPDVRDDLVDQTLFAGV